MDQEREEIKRHSEVIHSILCDLVGHADVVRFNRLFSEIIEMDISTYFNDCGVDSIKKVADLFFQGRTNNCPSDLSQAMRTMYAGMPEDMSRLVQLLPGMMNCLPGQTSQLIHLLRGMSNVLPKEMHQFRSVNGSIHDLERRCSQAFEKLNCYLNIFKAEDLQNFETLTSSMKGKFQFIMSGSRAEGFEFKTSDFDLMLSTSLVKVIQIPTKEKHIGFPLFMEKCKTRPGFVRLKTPHDPGFLNMVFIRHDHAYYLSSSLIKQYSLHFIHSTKGDLILHGPCLTSSNETVDLAITLSLDSWPHDAVGCVHRMLNRKWPSYDVIQKIVSDCCLFVPIGCRSSTYEEIEWRMSFSLAEKRLVHSMNHTQFLTYALLKYFLKEVVGQNERVKGLLCSYFMKTSVFWEIMETKIPWNPSYLLQHFWNCFRRLLNWISKEYCPNFFIPENNMFFGKIHGCTCQNLLSYLGSLYRDGFVIFHHIPSLKLELDKLTAVPRPSSSHELRRSRVIQQFLKVVNLGLGFCSAEMLNVMESSQCSIILEYCHFLRLSKLNVSCSRTLCEQIKIDYGNKIRYLKEKALFRIIRASAPDRVRGKIVLALYFYRCERYDQSILLLHEIIRKVNDEETICTWTFEADKYSSLGGDILSVFDGMSRYTVSNVPLDPEICIPEILEECRAHLPGLDFLLISPFVISYFLLFLCHFRKGDSQLARVQMTELDLHIKTCIPEYIITEYRTNEYSIDNKNVPHNIRLNKALSWEVLGVAQEIIGDFRESLNSFKECNRISSGNQFIALDQTLLCANKGRILRIETYLNCHAAK